MPNEKADQVFIIEDGEHKKTYPSFSFESELFGDKLEKALQNLIEKVPEKIIPGSQIDPGSDNPPKFIVLSREMPVESWSLDFLLVDQYGKPTLLEAKLFQNPEARRSVVGQILDYAAGAEKAWGNGRLKNVAHKYWAEKGMDLDEVIEVLINDDMDPEEFWGEVEENIQNGDLRLIVAMESFTTEARRIIEFLNKEMKNVEILGVEIRCYGESENDLIVSPVVIGQTQSTADRKAPSDRTEWGYLNLKMRYDKMEENTLKERLIDLLEWANDRNVLKEIKAQNPLLGLIGKVEGRRIFSIYEYGKIYVFFNPKDFDYDLDERNEFAKRLNEISIFNFDMDEVEQAKEGRTSEGKLDEMSDEEYEYFKKILDDFCNE